MKKAVIIIVGLLSIFDSSNSKSIKAGCSIRVDKDLPEPQPLVLNPRGRKDGLGFYLPADNEGIISISAGADVLLACSGNSNYLMFKGPVKKTTTATCISGTTFNIDSESYNFSEFACNRYPHHVAREFGSNRYDGTKINIEIGFEVESNFYKIIDICFDAILLNSVYSKATIVSGIGGHQSGFPYPSYIQDHFYQGLSVGKLYKKKTQRQTFSQLLNSTELGYKYIPDKSNYFLARGHLTAKADFVYGSEQRATFHYVNVAPQWQTLNGNNWNALEMSVRTYADKQKLTLVVYTGTYGVATLPDVNGIETELYLYVDSNNKKGIPVPKLYWKVVYDPKTKAGIAFIGVNNPYVSNLQEEYLICDDVCSELSWMQWDQTNIHKGYCYCCEVNDFRVTVDTLPEFTVSRLLK